MMGGMMGGMIFVQLFPYAQERLDDYVSSLNDPTRASREVRASLDEPPATLLVLPNGWVKVAAALPGTETVVRFTATALAAAQHDHLAEVDLRGVLGDAFLVLVLPVLDLAFHVQAVALLHVALDHVNQAAPGHDAVPLRFFLLLALLVVPGARGGQGELRHPLAAPRAADLRVLPQVADQDRLVQAARHSSSSSPK